MSYDNRLPSSPDKGQTCRNYYQVLEISPDERDPQVIEEAALRCSSQVRVYQVARELECARELNEIAQALNTLLDPAQRRAYDLRLAKPAAAEEADPQPPPIPILTALQCETGSARPSVERPHQFRGDAAKTCDVTLVYRRRAI
jgi:hypothetical protein